MPEKQPDFDQLFARLIADGVSDIEVECDRNEWFVIVIQGHIGLGVARYSKKKDMAKVDEALNKLRKAKKVTVDGKTYALRFRYRENFGEPCWRIKVLD